MGTIASSTFRFLLLSSLILAVMPGEATASADDVDAAEALLVENSVRAAIEAYGELLENRDLDPALRARAHRGLAIAYQARDDRRSMQHILEAVLAEPTYLGNPWLVQTLGGFQGTYGPPEGWADQLARLEALAAEHPRLQSSTFHILAAYADMRGQWDEMAGYPASVGVICDLLVAGPFDNVASSGMTRAFPPEAEIDIDAEYIGLDGRPLRWTPARCGPYGVVDLDEFMDSQANALLYGLTHVRAEEQTEALLRVSGAGAFRAWVNGTMVLDESEHRASYYDLYRVAVTLEQGWNRILVKVGAEFDPLALRVGLSDRAEQGLTLQTSARPPQGAGPFPGAAPVLSADALAEFDWRSAGWRDWPLGKSFVDRLITVHDLLNQDRVDAAGTLIDELRETHPASGLVAAARLRVLRSKDSPEAESLARTIADLAPDYFAYRLTRFNELREQGEADAAFEALQEMRADFPDNLALQSFYGAMQMGRGDTAEGLAAIEAAFEAWPANQLLQMMVLNSLQRMNQIAAYHAALERCHEVRPDFPDHARTLANVAYEARDLDRALEYLDRALRANGPQALIHQERATVLESDGRQDEAIEACEEALTWAPQGVNVRERLAKMLLAAGRREQAVEHLEFALAMQPASGSLRELLRTVQGKPSLSELFPKIDLESLRDADLSWADPTAGACYLFDDLQLVVFESGATELRRHYAILLRNEGAAANYRKIQAATGDGLEIARALKADGRTIDGEVGYGEITFPELAAGDVLEVRVRSLGTPIGGLPGHFWADNRFQYEAPCLLSRYSVLSPPDRSFEWVVHNGELEHQTTDFDDWVLHAWEAREVPALRFETAGPAILDFALWLDISSLPSWDLLVDWFRSESEGRLRATPEVLEFARGLQSEAATDSARVYAASTWVRENIEYEGGQFVGSPTVPRQAAAVLNTRYGDCKDQSGLIISALRAMDIDANFALVNARDVLTAAYLPSARFSHAIVHVPLPDGREYWIDPTLEQLGFPNVPIMLEGMTALLIDERQESPFVTIPLDPTNTDGTQTRVEGRFVDDDMLALTGESVWVGEEGTLLRDIDRSMPEYMESIFEEMLGGSHPGAVIEDWGYELGDRREDDPVLRFALSIPSPLSEAGNLRILRIPWTMWTVPGELVTTRTRETALELYEWRGVYHEEVLLEMPAGYSPLALPEPFVLENDYARFELVKTIDDQGRLRVVKELAFERLRIEPSEYEEFREFVLAGVKAEQEQVVLQAVTQ